ncbi:MAG: transglycosylase SLT domain-containing protein [Terracidiphilus sp.]
MSRNPYRLTGCAVLALLLAGCEKTPQTGAPAATAPQATAPAVTEKAPAKPAPPTPAELRQQQVSALIGQVEAAYARGEAAYRIEHLLEAKIEFDRAVDLMLSSNIEIQSEPRLQDEFNRIVDQVNALEMDALKQGNGFAPKVEPTPADVAEDVTFEVDPNLVAKVKADLATTKSDLPLMVNDYVAAYINFFANTKKGHYTLLHSFQRSGRYKAMIQKVMADEGVPQDLIYLAVAESGFQPTAVNRKSGAGGMWQFMPHGDYGLARNGFVDERFDPEKSTRAYARYMKFIYDQLGDWYLTMAGYDWGAGNVQRAVEKTGYADFWELYKRNNLPGETKNYVPEILAAIIIANHPTQYGFDDLTLDPPLVAETVTVNYPIDLRLVADLVDSPVTDLVALNPSLLRLATPPDTSFDLHLPAGKAADFAQRVAAIPENKRNSWRYHRVTPDDTLASVAREYRVSAADLASANQLSEGDEISKLEALVVPVPPAATPSARMQTYTARKGDTLVTIADRFGVSLNQLRRWNKIAGIKVETGRKLRVAEPAAVQRTSHGRKHAKQSAAKTSEAAPTKGEKAKHAAEAPKKAEAKPKTSTKKQATAKSDSKSKGAKKNSSNRDAAGSAHKPAAHAKGKNAKEK